MCCNHANMGKCANYFINIWSCVILYITSYVQIYWSKYFIILKKHGENVSYLWKVIHAVFLKILWKVFCILWKLVSPSVPLSVSSIVFCDIIILRSIFNRQDIIFSMQKEHVHTDITTEYALIARFLKEGAWNWTERKVKWKDTCKFFVKSQGLPLHNSPPLPLTVT